MSGESAALAHAPYIVGCIKKICAEFGPRSPGSPGETRCQEYLAGELRSFGLEPLVEPFPVAQKAFMAMPAVCGGITLFSLPFYWFFPPAAALLALLATAVFVLELFFYKHVLSPFFPKHTSHNVSAAVAPSGPVRRRVILCGHADAAYEWVYQHAFTRYFLLVNAVIILSFFYLTVTSILHALFAGGHQGLWFYVGLTQLFAGIGPLLALFYTRFSVVSPGAGDNLSGSLLTVAMARHFNSSENRLENTELVTLVTGSEEAGLCGAREYVRRHQGEWRDVETVTIALDTIVELEHLAVYNRDRNGMVRHDPALCALLKETGKALGLDLPYASVTVGSSDGTAFSEAGHRAAMLAAMDPAPAHYYHNRRDSWEMLDERCLETTCQLVSTALRRIDMEGIPKP